MIRNAKVGRESSPSIGPNFRVELSRAAMPLKSNENQLTGGNIGAEVSPQLSRRIFAKGRPDGVCPTGSVGPSDLKVVLKWLQYGDPPQVYLVRSNCPIARAQCVSGDCTTAARAKR